MNEGKKEKRKLRIWFGFACIVLIFLIGGFLWEFNVSMQKAEQERNRDTMESLAEQAGLVAESKLTSIINVLETASAKIEMAESVSREQQVQYLQKIAENSGMDRIGIADVNGDVVTTNGLEVNVKDRTYFKTSMQGDVYISTVFQAHVLGGSEESIVISVPLLGDGEKPKGVLYGVILVENFNIYANSELNEESGKLVDIIDYKGNLLVMSDGEHKHGAEDNFFEVMEKDGVDTKELVGLIQERKSAYQEAEVDGERMMFYFSPMKVENWCVVTSLTENAQLVNIDYSQKIVLRLILKMLLVVAAFVAMGYYVVTREKLQIKALNRELLIKDRVFQIAITETGSYVFIYDTEKKSMHFINHSAEAEKIFPKTIENFPRFMEGIVKRNSVAYQEIQRFLDEIDKGNSNIEGEVSLDMGGKIVHYNVRVVGVSAKDGKQTLMAGIMVDVTKERQNEIILRSQIGKDPLTKTYNRGAATDKINEILKAGEIGNCAFLIMDLDNFKTVNDSLGHLAGDKVLVDVANIIRRHVRPKDIVCRLGGDEFIIFLVDIPKHVVQKNVEALLKKLNLTYEENGTHVSCSASVGIVLAPEGGSDFRILYEKADKALYRAKQAGKNQFSMYAEENGLIQE